MASLPIVTIILENGLDVSESLEETIKRLQSGDKAAAEDIYLRYEKRLLRLAEQLIGSLLQSRIDPDDVVLSVLDSVIARFGDCQYSVDPSGTIFHLLRTMTKTKILKYWQHHTQQMRDVRAEVRLTGETGFREDPSEQKAESPVVDRNATPAEIVMLADLLEAIRVRIKEEDFQILELRIQGYSNPEIAKKLGRAATTVRYKMERIQRVVRQLAETPAQ